jgi:hypothetical protein
MDHRLEAAVLAGDAAALVEFSGDALLQRDDHDRSIVMLAAYHRKVDVLVRVVGRFLLRNSG